MDQGGVRKTVEIKRQLVKPLKQLMDDSGLGLDELVNMGLYDLLVRCGHVRPQAVPVSPPPSPTLAHVGAGPAPPRPPQRQAAARPLAAAPREEVLYFQVDNEEPVAVRKRVFLLGRGSKCDYVLRDPGVSREHAVITRERGGWFIEDLHSANGVWLGGEQISKHKLSDGDVLQITKYALRFSIRSG